MVLPRTRVNRQAGGSALVPPATLPWIATGAIRGPNDAPPGHRGGEHDRGRGAAPARQPLEQSLQVVGARKDDPQQEAVAARPVVALEHLGVSPARAPIRGRLTPGALTLGKAVIPLRLPRPPRGRRRLPAGRAASRRRCSGGRPPERRGARPARRGPRPYAHASR